MQYPDLKRSEVIDALKEQWQSKFADAAQLANRHYLRASIGLGKVADLLRPITLADSAWGVKETSGYVKLLVGSGAGHSPILAVWPSVTEDELTYLVCSRACPDTLVVVVGDDYTPLLEAATRAVITAIRQDALRVELLQNDGGVWVE